MRVSLAVVLFLAELGGACAGQSLPPRFASVANDEILALAEAGDLDAQVALGQVLESGRGGAPDYVAAAVWYRRAAAAGNPLGQYRLGQLHEYGHGVDQDYAAAARWYRAAAEGGSDVAGFQLGYLYENGLGVPRDVAQAVAWYDRAIAAWRARSSYPLAPGHMLVTLPPAAVVPAIQVPDAAPDPPPAPPPAPEPETFAALEPAATYAHLASFRSPAEASAAWAGLRDRHPDLLATLDHALAELDLGVGSGVFYQLLAGPLGDGDKAAALCDALHARGQYCNPVAP